MYHSICSDTACFVDYVQEHWDEDEFFGYQFLNGLNPMMIQRCSKLPANFRVTEEMVKDSLGGSSLEVEMKVGSKLEIKLHSVYTGWLVGKTRHDDPALLKAARGDGQRPSRRKHLN